MTTSSARLSWWPRSFGAEYAYFSKWGWAARQVIRVLGLMDLASRLRWRMVAAQLGRRRFKRVLDAGCGTGVLAFHLVRTGRAAFVDGIDVRREVIEEASLIANRLNLHQVRFHLANMSNCQSPSGQPQYDLIVCVEALTYSPDIAGTLARFCGQLTPDGLLFLTLPHDRRLDNPRHFDLEQAKQMLVDSGFEVIRAEYVIGGYHAALIAVFDFLARFIRPFAPVALPFLLLLARLKRFPVSSGQFVMALATPCTRTGHRIRKLIQEASL